MKERTDEELIRLTLSGEKSAFVEIVRRYERRVAVTVRGVIQDASRDEIADLTQDIFLLAYKSLGSFRGDAQFGTYITRIALRHCWRAAKRRRKRSSVTISYDAEQGAAERLRERLGGGEGADREVLLDERRQAVMEALGQLPEEFRIVLLMRIVQELPVEQCAEILKVSTGTVKSRLYRGREKMRELLEGTGLEFDPGSTE